MGPRGTSEDNMSQHSDIQLRGSHEEDNEEEPPPPYPGNVALPSSHNTRSTDHIWHTSLRPARQSTRALENEATGENGPSSSDGRASGARSNQGHHVVGPSGVHVVNAWINNEAVHRIGETSNEMYRTDSCQSNPEGRNLDVNQRDPNFSRTSVSHSSLQGARGAVSTSHTLPSEHTELTETV